MAKTTSLGFNVEVVSHDAALEEEVMQNWPKLWKAAGFSEDSLEADWKNQMEKFWKAAKDSDLQPQTFVARDAEGATLGSIHCQIWAGPVPWVVQPQVFRLGTVWGLFVKEAAERSELGSSIRRELLGEALMHLKREQCSKAVTLALTTAEREKIVQARVDFQQANMLTLDLMKDEDWKEGPLAVGGVLCKRVGSADDATVCSHWRRMWQDVGIPEEALLPDMEQATSAFIKEARRRLDYQTFLARCPETQKTVATISCQVWEGPFPKIVKPERSKLGSVWAVYVHPGYRRQGVATCLMKLALQHLKSVGCDSAILIAASEGGQRVYERLGFRANNAVVCDLLQVAIESDEAALQREETEEKKQEESDEASYKIIHQELREALGALFDDVTDDLQLNALRTATTQQLLAVYRDHSLGTDIVEAVARIQRKHGLFIDPQDNWFTQRLAKAKDTAFGKGFDMNHLNNPSVLASKFDRLANRYDHWTVGNQSKVESFIVRCARETSSALSEAGTGARVLDIACGIGLQGQVLRLCGFKGELVGSDISSGMVRRVKERGCYNHAYVWDANQSSDRTNAANVTTASVGEEDTEVIKNLSEAGDALESIFSPAQVDVDANLVARQKPYDVVICTGAMELLDHQTVLVQISKMTRPGGELWVSFQLDVGEESPTQHQNVQGVTRNRAIGALREAGFHERSVEACSDAFYTPSPARDGSLLAVPYLFVVATKVSQVVPKCDTQSY